MGASSMKGSEERVEIILILIHMVIVDCCFVWQRWYPQSMVLMAVWHAVFLYSSGRQLLR